MSHLSTGAEQSPENPVWSQSCGSSSRSSGQRLSASVAHEFRTQMSHLAHQNSEVIPHSVSHASGQMGTGGYFSSFRPDNNGKSAWSTPGRGHYLAWKGWVFDFDDWAGQLGQETDPPNEDRSLSKSPA